MVKQLKMQCINDECLLEFETYLVEDTHGWQGTQCPSCGRILTYAGSIEITFKEIKQPKFTQVGLLRVYDDDVNENEIEAWHELRD